jgi:hypothetical protein
MKWQTIKTVLLSAIGGAVVWWIVLAAGWGWMSSASAEKLASERAHAAVLEALTPICVANFQQDTEREAKLAALKEASSWSRSDYVVKQGWATMPGSDTPEQGIATACVSRILELESTS